MFCMLFTFILKFINYNSNLLLFILWIHSFNLLLLIYIMLWSFNRRIFTNIWSFLLRNYNLFSLLIIITINSRSSSCCNIWIRTICSNWNFITISNMRTTIIIRWLLLFYIFYFIFIFFTKSRKTLFSWYIF